LRLCERDSSGTTEGQMRSAPSRTMVRQCACMKPEGDGADSPTRANDAPEVRRSEAARPNFLYKKAEKQHKMIRILHTSDWHLGVKLENQLREEEHQQTLQWLTELIQREKVEVLIIAGDIFDVYMPASYAQRLYYNFLKSLVNTCCQHIIVIGGNHDSPNLLEASRELLQVLNIHVVAQITDDRQSQIIELRDHKSQEVKAVIAAVPYLSEAVLRKSQLGETAEARREQIRAGVVAHYQSLADLVGEYKAQNIPIIATGHLFVAGGERGERNNLIHLGNIDLVEPSAFPEIFDYIALGHLHKAHGLGKNRHIRYAGSLIPLDFNEINYKHQVYIVDFVDGKLEEVQPHYNPYCRPLRLLRGSLAEIEAYIAAFPDEMPENQHFKTWVKIEAQTDTPFIANFKQQLLAKIGSKPLEILGEPIQRRIYADDGIETEMLKALAAVPSLDSISPEEVFDMRLKSQQYEDPVVVAQFQADFRDLQIWWQERSKN
jgi:DNA repair protein SbcD/Mre11